MKALMKPIIVVCIFLVPASAGQRQVHDQDSSNCGVMREALVDWARIKVGSHRNEVEKYFAKDGGGQFPSNTRYIYPKCAYLHVDINFEATGPVEHLFSADDIVTQVSKLYVDYPSKD